MWLQVRLYLLLGLMLGIVYAFITGVATAMGGGTFMVYGIVAFVLVFIQFLIGPAMVGWSMKVKYVSEQEQPELHGMVAELARRAEANRPGYERNHRQR